MKDFLTIGEVARFLGVTTQAVYRLIDRGSLASVWLLGRRVVRKEAVEELAGRESYRKQSDGRRAIDRAEKQGVFDLD